MCDAFHMPSIISQVIGLGIFLEVLISPLYAPVMLSVFCALCHGEYQHLTQLIRPFILMEFSLSAAIAAGWSPFFLLVRQSCLLLLWVELTDRLRQTKVFCLAGPASTLCHFPLLKLLKCTACNVHRLRTWDGEIITFLNYRFHAWFPGDTIQLHWQATLSETTGAWF